MPPTRRLLAYVGIGLVAGFLSGLFGVGGGILIVPALVLLLGFPQKVATGTSLLAIAPISLVGVASYAAHGAVDWVMGAVLAVGMVAGGVLGSWLLARLPPLVVTWVFIAALVAVAIRLMLVEPERGLPHPVGWLEVVLLLALGVVTGVLSGLVGVGGGVVIVPALVVLGGVSDVLAKGVSLLAMVPNAVVTSVLNLRRRNADLAAGLAIGLSGCATTVLGAFAAVWIDARIGAILFGVFLLGVAVQLAVRAVRRSRGSG